jgi:large subunit ribosomal protein L35
MKTHRGAAKRFKITKSGLVKYRCSFRNHILTKKAPKTMRNLRHGSYLEPQDAAHIKRLMPYG